MTICKVFVSVNVYETAIVVQVVTVTVKRFVVVTLMVVKSIVIGLELCVPMFESFRKLLVLKESSLGPR